MFEPHVQAYSHSPQSALNSRSMYAAIHFQLLFVVSCFHPLPFVFFHLRLTGVATWKRELLCFGFIIILQLSEFWSDFSFLLRLCCYWFFLSWEIKVGDSSFLECTIKRSSGLHPGTPAFFWLAKKKNKSGDKFPTSSHIFVQSKLKSKCISAGPVLFCSTNILLKVWKRSLKCYF